MARPIKHWHKYRYDEALGKWVRKKRYKHPVITVVKLDPDQALLAVCANAGLYFRYWGTDRVRVCVVVPGGAEVCSRTKRGRTTNIVGTRYLGSDFPS